MAAILDFSILSKLLKGDGSTPVWISLWGCQTWIIKREKNCIKQNKVYPHGCQTRMCFWSTHQDQDTAEEQRRTDSYINSKFPWRSLEGLSCSQINLLTNCFTVTINYINTNISITKNGNFVITKGRSIGGLCSGNSLMWDNPWTLVYGNPNIQYICLLKRSKVVSEC